MSFIMIISQEIVTLINRTYLLISKLQVCLDRNTFNEVVITVTAYYQVTAYYSNTRELEGLVTCLK